MPSSNKENAAMTTLPALIVTESTSLFDYSALDHAVGAEARATADRIRERIESSYLDTGRDLLGIKVKLGHGYFGKWLNAEFDMSERTAQNLMSLAEYANDKPATVANLSTTAVYKLAAPSTPTSVQEEIEQRVIKGEHPSTREIEEQIAAAKEELATEAAKARKLKVKSPAATRAMEKREKDKEDRERHESEEAERLRAKRDRAAREAVELLQGRLGDDLVRFTELCARAGSALMPALAELIKNPKPIVPEDDHDLDEVNAELDADEARHDPAKLTELVLSKAA
jgi:hypothetical protein